MARTQCQKWHLRRTWTVSPPESPVRWICIDLRYLRFLRLRWVRWHSEFRICSYLSIHDPYLPR